MKHSKRLNTKIESSVVLKSLIIALVGFMLIFAVLPSYDSFADKPDDIGKSKYSVSVEEITIPAQAKLPDGRIAEKVVHVFYEEGFAHRSGHDKGGGPPDKGGKGGGDKCFSVLAKGAKWKVVENYIVDPTNAQNIPDSLITQATTAGINEWNVNSPETIFGNEVTGTVQASTIGVSMNDQNEMIFADIDRPGVIAVTFTWGIYGGPPQARELVEWDAVYDDQDFDWGDATSNPALMDLQNIITHELGHSGGLGHPESTCVDETMYAFASAGETKKRDLNAGDKAGINNLY